MDTKFNIQDLAELVARKNKISRKEAETFVRTFFDTISTYLLREKIVKVKGLGTFKMVEVSDRESVDVNTGRRIMIEGHSKVSFTPDNTLRDQVNKPFCDFETVILNEDTDIAEMERIDTPIPVEDTDSIEDYIETEEVIVEVQPDSEEVPSIETEQNDLNESDSSEEEVMEESVLSDVEDDAEKPAEINEVEEENLDGVNEVQPEEQPITDETEQCIEEVAVNDSEAEAENSTTEYAKENTDKHTFSKIAKYFIVLLLMVASYFVGYYRVLCPCNFSFSNEQQIIEDTLTSKDVVEKTDTLVIAQKDSVSNELDSVNRQNEKTAASEVINVETDKQQKAVQKPKDIEQYPQIPGGKYLIVGTRGIHVMKQGDNLYKIARTNYGNNDFVKYIIVYNQFKNPDVIPPGYSIKLPELEEVK